MPTHKHNRHNNNNRARDDEHNNNVDEQQHDVGVGGGGGGHNNNYNNNNNNNQHQGNGGANDNQRTNGGSNQCCVPHGCSDIKDLIDPADPCDAVRVVCNNENCTVGQWMHKVCFETWEQGVLSYLRSCGRARSWSEKQRLQNLWTKKGYDLAFKACDCRCSRGHLRKDLDYIPPPHNDNAKKNRKHKKKNDKPIAVMTSKGGMGNPGTHGSRLRTNSISTGSSPPNSSLSSSPITPVGSPSLTSHINNHYHHLLKKTKPESVDYTVGSGGGSGGSSVCGGNGGAGGNGISNEVSGSIFKRRNDLSAFKNLRRYKQNPYYIKMEDECAHGNDDTRIFVLSTLSIHKMGSLPCVLCKCELAVFDRYPLIDGTLFLSPEPYLKNADIKQTSNLNNNNSETSNHHHPIQVLFDGKPQYLNAVCIHCLEGKTDIRCSACKKRWDGSTLLLGSMYSYDIFAAMPCCPKRLTCRHCCRAVVDVTTGLPYYSEYSHIIECPYCKIKDYHFIRPLNEIFLVENPIWS